MSDIKNLWPQELLNKSDLILPITILQEQAKYLNEMTRNVIIAAIKTTKVAIHQKESNKTKPALVHKLNIVAPAIGNYDFEIVRLIQEELFPYPLRIFAPLSEGKYSATNPEELQAVLSEIFQNPQSISAIQSLLLQSSQNDI